MSNVCVLFGTSILSIPDIAHNEDTYPDQSINVFREVATELTTNEKFRIFAISSCEIGLNSDNDQRIDGT
uniref:Uncharacterized protein n=1 Tax=Onchocerca volvulus TaxID=6282 RepID=A0A8R1TYN2_ONCVO